MKNTVLLALFLSFLAFPAHAEQPAVAASSPPPAVSLGGVNDSVAPVGPLAPITAPPPLADTMASEVPPLDLAARQAILIDTATGTVLYAKNADEPMPTSSLSKMMTLYLTFEALKDGKLHLNDMLTVSKNAWSQQGSRTFLNIGQKVSVEDLIRGVIVQSGNDAAVTLAEGQASGSEAAFVDLMNATAKELGMTRTHFVNATGLPDLHHYSTARDLATLALHLIRDFPQYYHYFSEETFAFNGIKQGNRNPLLYRNIGVDGLKTGHTDVGGYGLCASEVRNGRRLLALLNGMASMQARADVGAQLLDYGFQEFGLYPIAKKGDVMAQAKVWLGTHKDVKLVAAQDAEIDLPRAARSELKAVVGFTQPIAAPIKKGQQIGVLTISAPHMTDEVVPLVAASDVPRVGFFTRMWDKLGALLGGSS
ncbi:MAG: D-alanyl-D-alanine carboxypeptidase [Alphaproteobacteria bacterium]|nr:D-alanyl-D-alanine carboxypeptidase [Alphaproteobacteria bacterium]